MVKTAALLLKSRKYKEKDKLLSFFTQDLGRIVALCKSARSPNHRWGSSTEPPAFGFVQLYEKNHFYTLTEICTVESFLHDKIELDRLVAYQFVSSLIERYIPYALVQPQLFQKVQALFFYWKEGNTSILMGLYHFMIYFLSVQGYALSWKHCACCHQEVASAISERWFFDLIRGTIYCFNCGAREKHLYPISSRVCSVLEKIKQAYPGNLMDFLVTDSEWQEIDRMIGFYYKEKIDPHFKSYYEIMKTGLLFEKKGLEKRCSY